MKYKNFKVPIFKKGDIVTTPLGKGKVIKDNIHFITNPTYSDYANSFIEVKLNKKWNGETITIFYRFELI